MKQSYIIRLMRKTKHIAYLLPFLLTVGQVLADRGVILVEKDINLAEPAQRAIVAHNGTWEILILQTDVKTDKRTKTLEFMPLPSNPEVSLAPDDCFKNLQTLVTRHKLKYIVESVRMGTGGRSGKTEGISVVAEHDLGPHHITVVDIQDVNKFRSWVVDFAKRKGLGSPILSDDLDRIVADYCKRGLRFMAFDVLDVPAGTKTVAPVSYRFKCDHVYYPLKVTNLYGGKGTVEIFYVLNPWCDDNAYHPEPHDFSSYRKGQKEKGVRWISSRMAHLSADELRTIHPETEDLFGKSGACFFATKYDGQLQFDTDIWLSMGYASPEYLCMRFPSLLQDDIESLEFLLEFPFALNRESIHANFPEALAALRIFVKQHDLSGFQLKNRAVHSGCGRNEFDKLFIEKHLKGKRWSHYILSSDEIALHFFTINRNPKGLNDCKIVNFRVSLANDYR